MSSFVNERTIEYSLMMYMSKLFASEFENIIPFYYWKTREGNNVSKVSMNEARFRLLAIYPRRPKIDKKCKNGHFIKFNDQVLFDASKLKKLGVNVISATCHGDNLGEMGLKSNITWFYMFDVRPDYSTYHYNKKGELVENYYSPRTFSDKEIILSIKSSSLYSWNEILDKIDIWRKDSFAFQYGMYFKNNNYKPLFVLFE